MDAKIFWGHIKTLVKQKKMTQEEFAKATGISINTWRGWIYKGILPGIEHCALIAKHLNVSLDYLVKGQRKSPEIKIEKMKALLNRIDVELSGLYGRT